MYLRYNCILLLDANRPNSIIVDKSLENFSFNISKSGQIIRIKLLQDGKTIEAETTFDLSNENILQKLVSNQYEKLSESETTEFHYLTQPIQYAVKQYAGLLKQELHRFDIDDGLIANSRFEYSFGDNKWVAVPRKLHVEVEVTSLGNLNKDIAESIQQLLSEDEEALIATSYIHQARRSHNSRYKWIYTTIAAELAIKEVLVRFEPKLKVILEELPSPPINKLYGSVLESITGIRSTNINQLVNGITMRNELIHNPKSGLPSLKETSEYIDFVEEKIKWLLSEYRRIKRANNQNRA